MQGSHSQQHLRMVLMMEPGLMREGTLRVLDLALAKKTVTSLTVVDNLLDLRQALSLQRIDVILTSLTARRARLRDFLLFYSHYLHFNDNTTWLLYSEQLTPLLTTWSPLAQDEGPLCLPYDLQPEQLLYLLQKRQALDHSAFMTNERARQIPSDIVLSWRELQVLSHFLCNELDQLITTTGGFTPKTLSTYKRSAMRKLDVRCDQELHALLHQTYGNTAHHKPLTRKSPNVVLSH